MAKKIIISGGGTGGHIFPAIAIGKEIKQREPDSEILYVGAVGGLELKLVPKYGFPIKAVWISGIQRSMTPKNIIRNLFFPIKLIRSLMQSIKIVNRFKPDAVVGVGGYASGPLGRAAASRNIPLIICEQNAYPGLTNKWLAPKASKILLGNAAATKYFDKNKVVVTGNPIRKFELPARAEAAKQMGLDPDRPILLSLGGSLGARSINAAIEAQLPALTGANVQLVWQSGKRYYEELKSRVPAHKDVKLMAFIEDMATAYAAADLIISRAGGSTISEMIALSKPSILVPSPNVSEDHQTKNALSLADNGAAMLIKDVEAKEKLIPTALEIVQSQEKLEQISKAVRETEKHDAAKEIVDQIFSLIKS